MKNKILFITLLLSLIPLQVYAQSAVIGQDETFVITPMTILTSGTPEAAVHNYFFTLEIFYGMVALFIRLILKLFKL
ncbi:MAG: hypothetical protein D3906_03340 [Candidatus Electrothrix sp. AUS1_2]|nr:hypothetical protein [Candidatus Electrothrix sp. AUS1_2]